jgi:hypothetical protein
MDDEDVFEEEEEEYYEYSVRCCDEFTAVWCGCCLQYTYICHVHNPWGTCMCS